MRATFNRAFGVPTALNLFADLPLSRPKLKLSSSPVYEIGYKGLVEDKLRIAVDQYQWCTLDRSG